MNTDDNQFSRYFT